MLAKANGKQEQPASEKEKEKEREKENECYPPYPLFANQQRVKIFCRNRGALSYRPAKKQRPQ